MELDLAAAKKVFEASPHFGHFQLEQNGLSFQLLTKGGVHYAIHYKVDTAAETGEDVGGLSGEQNPQRKPEIETVY